MEDRDLYCHFKQPLNDIILRDFPENTGFRRPRCYREIPHHLRRWDQRQKTHRVHACRSSPVKYHADTRATPKSCSHYRLGTSGMVPGILGILQSQANESVPGASAYRMG
ncbi:hypothetical protein CGCVW01_v007209 [Colletotrichum viniferum]|nr:hypothetical protein CGCVW01_v007209 [Colletotrichum viniferum]